MAVGALALAAVGLATAGWFVLGDTSGQNAEAAPAAVTQPAPQPASAELDQPASDGALEFTVTAIECNHDQVADDGPAPEGQFCLATVHTTNTGDAPRTFDASYQIARDATGHAYEADTNAGLYANQHGETFLNELAPGQDVTGMLVFDLPSGTDLTALELHESAGSRGVTVSR